MELILELYSSLAGKSYFQSFDEEDSRITEVKCTNGVTTTFTLPIADETSFIGRAFGFKMWNTPDEYLEYTGQEYALFNTTNNCIKFIPAHRTKSIVESCILISSSIDTSKDEFWERKYLSQNPSALNPSIVETRGYNSV